MLPPQGQTKARDATGTQAHSHWYSTFLQNLLIIVPIKTRLATGSAASASNDQCQELVYFLLLSAICFQQWLVQSSLHI